MIRRHVASALILAQTVIACPAALAVPVHAQTYNPPAQAAAPDLSGYAKTSDLPAAVATYAPVKTVQGTSPDASGNVPVSIPPAYTDSQAVAAGTSAGFVTASQASATAAAAASTAAASVPTDVTAGSYTIATLPSATANGAKRVLVTDLGGGPAYLQADAANACWKRVGQINSYQTQVADTTGTLTYLTNGDIVLATGALTANRVWSLSTTNACKGAFFRVIRSFNPGDTFTLTVAGVNVQNGSTADFHYDGTTWVPGGITANRIQWAQLCSLTTSGGLTLANWTYPVAYPTGTVPYTVCTVQAPAGSTALYNCQANGAATNTAASFAVNQVPTATVSLLSVTSIQLFQAAPTNTCVTVIARQPG